MRLGVFAATIVAFAVVFSACGSKVAVEEGAKYVILSKSGTTCLDVPGGSQAAGTGIVLWSVHSLSNSYPNQNWMFRQAESSDEYKIVSANSELHLDVSGGSDANGIPIVQWPDNGPAAANQTWIFEKSGEYVKIRSKQSGKYMSTADGSHNAGIGIVQNEAVPEMAESQLWILKKIQ